jgi:hypothetical protein
MRINYSLKSANFFKNMLLDIGDGKIKEDNEGKISLD